jgi:hypothetical protein
MRMVEGRIGIISGAASGRGAQRAELAGEEGRLETRKAEAAKAEIAEICAQTGPVPRSGVPDDIAQALLWLASNRFIFDGGGTFTQHHVGVKRVGAGRGLSCGSRRSRSCWLG